MKRETTAGDGCSLAALVRAHDRDRYLTALFAPAPRRAGLLALYAFNYEVARVRETVSEPTLGLIRLHWWRETIAEAYGGVPPRRHAVAAPLAAVIRELVPTRAHFDRLIDAREQDLAGTPPATLAALVAYAEATSSGLVELALECLGVSTAVLAETARAVGVAYAVAGLLRAIPLHAAAGYCMIPQDIAARSGLDRHDCAAAAARPALRAAVGALAAIAAAELDAVRRRRMPRRALPALLPAAIAARALERLRRNQYDPFAPGLVAREPLQSWRLGALALAGRFL